MSLTLFETILLDCIVTVVISACIKKPIKIDEFLCSHFNIECGRKYATFSAYHALKICAVYGECAVTDQTYQKWFVMFLCIIDILAK